MCISAIQLHSLVALLLAKLYSLGPRTNKSPTHDTARATEVHLRSHFPFLIAASDLRLCSQLLFADLPVLIFAPTNATMAEYVGALDQGTTSTRFIIFSSTGNPVCSHQLEHNQYYPKSGWVEHDALEILTSAKKCIDACIRLAAEEHAISPSQIKAIGITNQRETTVVWDRNTGIPLCKAIVWMDARTHDTASELRRTISSETVRSITGLPISTYFSGVKFLWMLDNVPEVRTAVANGTAMFGTIDTWLVWNLTTEAAHVTDVTNAGRTMLMNIRTLNWDETMMSIIGVKRDILPEIRSCSEVYGTMEDTMLKGVPITGLIGDQQAALVGQSCFSVGEGKNTYGTGCFLIINTGEEPKFSKNGLLTTPAYKIGKHANCIYSLEGSVAIAGALVQWMRDKLRMIDHAGEIEALAGCVSDTGNVYCVPAFSGLFAPRWREDARGTIVGMTQFTEKAHLARAMLASITYQVNDVLRAASEDMGAPIRELKVDGGASVNNLLLQMQADITDSAVVRPQVVETTALGAAFVAGHEVGLFQSQDAFQNHWQLDRKFEPNITENERQTRLCKWEAAVERSLGWGDVGTTPARRWCMPSKQVVIATVVSACAASLITSMIFRYSKK